MLAPYTVFIVLACVALCVVDTHAASNGDKVILVSIDGLRYDYLRDAAERGANIPTLQRMIREGAWAPEGQTGILPTVTYPSHTSLVSGVSPAVHSIQDNTVFDPTNEHNDWQGVAGSAEWYWNYSSITARTLFDALEEDENRAAASVFWPVTVTAPIIHNVPEIWPLSLLPQLCTGVEDTDILDQIEALPTQWAFDTDRHAIAMTMLKNFAPDLLTIHYADLDHFEHPNGVFSSEAMDTLTKVDSLLAEIIDTVESDSKLRDAHIIVTADHGFEDVQSTVYPNVLFDQMDKSNGEKWTVYAWAAGGSAGIYVNPKIADVADAQAKVDHFLQDPLRIEAWGIDTVLTPDQFEGKGFTGAYRVVGLKPGFFFSSAKSGTDEVGPSASKKGTHGFLPSSDNMKAAFVLWGPRVTPGYRFKGPVSILDVAPTAAAILDVSLPDAEGHALSEAMSLKPIVKSGALVGVAIFGAIVCGGAAATVLYLLGRTKNTGLSTMGSRSMA